MNILLKKSDRVVLLVGIFLGCVALAHPYLKTFLSSRPTKAGLSQVNGKPVKLEKVKVKIPKFVKVDKTIDLNTAGKDKLTELSGVGPVLSERIVAYRDAHGDFTSLEELEKVNGIGPTTVDRIGKRLKVGDSSS
ncbi:MAG: ComEA family DNA-binding protein [Candidatus Bipolaricaulia bacterium]